MPGGNRIIHSTISKDMRQGQNSKSTQVGVSLKKADLVNQNTNPQFARKILLMLVSSSTNTFLRIASNITREIWSAPRRNYCRIGEITCCWRLGTARKLICSVMMVHNVIKFLFSNQNASASLGIFKALFKQLKGSKGIMGGLPKFAQVDEPNFSNFLLDARWKRFFVNQNITKGVIRNSPNLMKDSPALDYSNREN
ncbi:hypothetical protein CMV_000252 [Castanea mollissima]|uniref:Uncharacterized protein n=1 Tax=Castanea mollissima TaxID=60419 RepID=A0A8J4W7K8_9ROSI|nr:hypothetical protein CMV_000252 [Castanea mollissima]